MPFLDLPSWMLAGILTIDLIAIVRAVTRARGVQKTLAWLLAIIAFPGIGGVLYLTMANPSIRRTTRRRIARRTSLRGSAHHGRAQIEAEPRLSSEAEPVFALASRTVGLPPTAGNRVEMLVEEMRTFKKMEQALERAQHTIWTQYYIVQNDETGRRFLDILAERARAGVEVRFLFDAFGSWRLDPACTRAIREAGGHVEAFLPVNPLRRRWAVHLRNHRKIVIVDGETGFTGGMNVGDEYSGRARRRGGKVFRDTNLEIHGPAVADLAQIFIEDWAYATGETLEGPAPTQPVPGSSSVAIVPSGPDQEYNASQLVYFSLINSARRRLWLTCPYFIPDEAILSALLAATLRGVDVRLLAPAASDVFVAALAGRSYFPPLARAGVRIYEYLPAILHAKTMVVDDELSLVGSANVDIRSFVYNFEISVLIGDPAFAAVLAERFEEDQLKSREYVIGSTSFGARLLQGCARLFSPLL
jgi:cardiolipin synthase